MADYDQGEGTTYEYSFEGTDRVYHQINHTKSGRTQCRPWGHRQRGIPGQMDGRPLQRRVVTRGEWEVIEDVAE